MEASVLYFDYAALPILGILLFTIFLRKATGGLVNRLFIGMIVMTLIAVCCDIWIGWFAVVRPLSTLRVVLSYVFCYIYFFMNSGIVLVHLFFLFSLTRTMHRLKNDYFLAAVMIPYVVLILVMSFNLFDGIVFEINRIEGYVRGPYIAILYVVSFVYGIFGVAYLVATRSLLKLMNQISLISLYVFSFAAVIVQYFLPTYLIEMFAITIALLFISLVIQRPEEILDPILGLPSYKAYKEELYKITKTKKPCQILAIRFINAAKVRSYLGEEKYHQYLIRYARPIMNISKSMKYRFEVYCETIGAIYIIINDMDFDVTAMLPLLTSAIEQETKSMEQTGAKLAARFCLICYPEDLNTQKEILYLGSEFAELIPYEQTFSRASDIIKSRNYQIGSNIDTILGKAISERSFEVYYQPIYSVKEKKFLSAEALIRLHDKEHGPISPGIFIPFAESRGLILPIGDIVLESVYQLISKNDLSALGLSYIEINLSVAQCISKDLLYKIKQLEERYRVSPSNINLEITESMYGEISTLIDKNMKDLTDIGYSISLDDYGVGYSNIQRILKLPLKIVKIDKSLVDGIGTSNGMSILKNTVNMLKDINMELVIEGVETEEVFHQMVGMECDYIQGFYFSKPLPEKDFIEFIKKYNVSQMS